MIEEKFEKLRIGVSNEVKGFQWTRQSQSIQVKLLEFHKIFQGCKGMESSQIL